MMAREEKNSMQKKVNLGFNIATMKETNFKLPP